MLILLFGSLAGLSLGLTGGGGAILAVPLLVYGLGVLPKDAIGISLASIGLTSLVGFLGRWRQGEADIRTGLLVAVAGMASTPVGAGLANRLPETALVLAFAGLMLVVALRMWQQASHPTPSPVQSPDGAQTVGEKVGRQHGPGRRLAQLLVLGIVTGGLSGLFGVGGGFIIVPALVVFAGMALARAVGTSLMVVALVSAAGLLSHFWQGREIPLQTSGLFALGGVMGLFAGTAMGRRLPAAVLQRLFAAAIFLVAAMMILHQFWAGS